MRGRGYTEVRRGLWGRRNWGEDFVGGMIGVRREREEVPTRKVWGLF